MKTGLHILAWLGLALLAGCDTMLPHSRIVDDGYSNWNCCSEENYQSGYYYNGYQENGWRYCVVKRK